MSYVYLLDLYQIIDTRIDATNQILNNITNDPGMIKFQEGRMELLCDLKEFLSQNLNPKLPRGLRQKALLNKSLIGISS